MRDQAEPAGVWGFGLGLGLALWTVVVGAVTGGRAWPMVALTLGAVAMVVGAGRVARARPDLVWAAVAAAPLVAAGVPPTRGEGLDLLGYANASAALFVVSGAGAMLLAGSVRGVALRRVAWLIAGVWLLAPWGLGALTASVFALLLPLALVLVRRRRTVRALLAGSAGLVAVGVVLTVVLGLGYQEGGRAGAADRFVDTTLGELRVVLWGEATDIVLAGPLHGVGPGRFREVSPTALARDDALWAHSEYLQVAAETGLPGGILLLALVGWLFRRLWQVADTRMLPAVVALAAVTVNLTIDYLLHFPVIPVTLATLVAAAAAAPGSAFRFEAAAVPYRIRIWTVATLTLLGVLLAPLGLLNPPVTVPNGAAWTADTPGLRLTGAGGLLSAEPPLPLYERLGDAQQLSVELLVETHDHIQGGPARILSLSEGTINRNLTVGQQEDALVVRLRTTATDWNATDAEVAVPDVFVGAEVQYIVVTTDIEETRVYVDGDLRWSGVGPGGRLDNWNHTYPLLVGNELSGDRGWSGDVRLLAVYDQSLPSATVEARAAEVTAGPTALATPAALYTFDEAEGDMVHDRSRTRAGGDLHIPARFPAPRQGFGQQLLEPDDRLARRLAGHTVVFAGWAFMVAAGWHRRRVASAAAVVGMVGGGVALAVTVSVLRYLQDRAPSLVDIAGAAVGCLLGLLVARISRRRTA